MEIIKVVFLIFLTIVFKFSNGNEKYNETVKLKLNAGYIQGYVSYEGGADKPTNVFKVKLIINRYTIMLNETKN